MRFAAIICLIFLFQVGFSQSGKIDFSLIDTKIHSISETSPQLLSYKLTSQYSTELEKVRSIFRWITENIEYKIYMPLRRSRSTFVNYEEDDDDLPGLKPLNERISSIVLKRKTAVCDQYARLFKTLCDYSGICSEVVMGYARIGRGSSKRFGTNHSWNAVQIDGKWHLMDVTWASGYLSYNGMEFIKNFDEEYFLTPPEQFIMDHYPDDLRWSLLSDPPEQKEFTYSPFKYSGFVKSKIVSVSPTKGIIETFVGDTIKIELETNDEVTNFFVTDILPSEINNRHYISNSFRMNGKKILFEYIPSPATKEWLYVFLNEELVLRYKLKVRKENASYAAAFSESVSQ